MRLQRIRFRIARRLQRIVDWLAPMTATSPVQVLPARTSMTVPQVRQVARVHRLS